MSIKNINDPIKYFLYKIGCLSSPELQSQYLTDFNDFFAKLKLFSLGALLRDKFLS